MEETEQERPGRVPVVASLLLVGRQLCAVDGPELPGVGPKEELKLSYARHPQGQEFSWARIFLQTRKPFAAALEVLAPYKKTVLTAWQRQLRQIRPHGEGSAMALKTDLWNVVRRVPQMSFGAFRGGLETLGEDFARREVPLDRIVSTMNALLETSLRYVIEDRPECAVAVLRLDCVARYVLISSYSHHQEARVRTLQQQLQEAEQRLHGASAYVTNVYEQERRRLSHDLHDDIGHDLVVLKLHLELLSADLEQRKLRALRPRLDDARVLVSHTIESVRRLVLDLGPTVFDDLGFLPAIKLYARRFSASTGIELSVNEGTLPSDIPLSHQTALYRVLQGALSNVLKHARAKHVRVALASLKNSVLVMTIEDDGRGFDTSGALPNRRFGLTAMRERIAVLGGRVHVQSWPTGPLSGRHGTRIEVDLPLPGAEPS